MENYRDIEMYLSDNDDKNIEIRKKSLIPSFVVMLIGILLVVIPATPLPLHHYLSMTMVVAGIILLVYGVLKFWIDSTRRKNVFVYIPDNKVMRRHSVYVDAADMQKVQQCIHKHNYAELSSVKKQMTSGHYIDVLGTADGRYFLIQMMDYIPHQFEAVSPVTVLTNKSAEVMAELIRK